MRSDDRGMWAVLGMFAASIVLVAIGATIAHRAYSERVREQGRARRAALLGDLALVVERRDGPLDLVDPFAVQWKRVDSLEVPVSPQNLAMPVLQRASLRNVAVSALTDGSHIAWRLVWKDSSPDFNVDTGRFCDAAALQFAIGENASFMMGGPGQLVQILHWKALWQKDIDEHFQDVQDLHPNFWADLYWFATGSFPYPVPAAFADTLSQQYFTARAAGNPGAAWDREQPCEELTAEGFGTLSPQPRSDSIGRGEWRNGQWALVIARPLRTEDPADYQFGAGISGRVGIAVWEGTSGNVGGRKHWSDWIAFEVE